MANSKITRHNEERPNMPKIVGILGLVKTSCSKRCCSMLSVMGGTA